MSDQETGVVVVGESPDGRYRQSIRSGFHELVADEPISVGGNDAGPSPYEYVLLGLGACTNMTVRMYAERRQIPLEKVRVRLSYQKVHAEDCS